MGNMRGFTLTELIVAITIIAVLSATGYSIYSGAQKSSRDGRRKADINAISIVLEEKINAKDNQYCPNSLSGQYCPLQGSYFKEKVIPKDPNGTDYTGLPQTPSYNYNICATLESGGTFCKTNLQ